MAARTLSGVVYLVVSKRRQGGYGGHELLFKAFTRRSAPPLPGEHRIPVRVTIDEALLEQQSDMQYVVVTATETQVKQV